MVADKLNKHSTACYGVSFLKQTTIVQQKNMKNPSKVICDNQSYLGFQLFDCFYSNNIYYFYSFLLIFSPTSYIFLLIEPEILFSMCVCVANMNIQLVIYHVLNVPYLVAKHIHVRYGEKNFREHIV